MSSVDDSGSDSAGSGQATDGVGAQVNAQLVEALILLLAEKGVLTRNDALSIVQTVTQVQRGKLVEGMEPDPQTRASVQMLQRMYLSFDALADRTGVAVTEAGNVHRLRPPIYDGRPEFPGDD